MPTPLPTDSTVESLAAATKLSIQDAKTMVYWRLASQYSEQLHFIPKLALVGPAGSGKTTNMEAMKAMPGESSPIVPCTLMTMAATRDLLKEWKDKLFIADEADDLKPEVAMLFMARSNRDMSVITYKEAVSNSKYEQKTADIFGPTIIHHRNEIEDPAQSSRSIQIFTRYEDGPYPFFVPDMEALHSIKLDMTNVPRYGGRSFTTWAPVLHVAEQIGDSAYLEAIQAEMDLHKNLLREKSNYDIASVILAKVVEIVVGRPALTRWDRIEVEYAIGQQIRFDYPNISPLVVGTTLRTLGFYTERKGGKLWLYPEKAAMQIAVRKRSYQDSELEEILAEGDHPMTAQEILRKTWPQN